MIKVNKKIKKKVITAAGLEELIKNEIIFNKILDFCNKKKCVENVVKLIK